MRWQEVTAGLIAAAVVVGIPVAAIAYESAHAEKVIPVELRQWQVTPEIHLKAGTQVHLLLTAMDVTHGFQIGNLINIPEIVPGHPREVIVTAVDPGTYEINCSNTCGVDHATMRGKIVVER
ncbi:MAG TPA: cupredoxin domain-containing protein [Symbiobacteriaceae bacterium]|jgi:heme/copper-type cytochrome/quinol oxidase subunit 2